MQWCNGCEYLTLAVLLYERLFQQCLSKDISSKFFCMYQKNVLKVQITWKIGSCDFQNFFVIKI